MTMPKVLARAWTDADYRAKLVNDPNAALAEAGIEVPDGLMVKVVEDTGDTQHLVLPAAPVTTGEIDMQELERIAGGRTSVSYAVGCC